MLLDWDLHWTAIFTPSSHPPPHSPHHNSFPHHIHHHIHPPHPPSTHPPFYIILATPSSTTQRNTDVEIKYVNYLLNEINTWMIDENERRLANFTQTVRASADSEREYLESRLGKKAFERFLKIYTEAKRGPEVRAIQQEVFKSIIVAIEKLLNFKYSVANNGATHHHPAHSCSIVSTYMESSAEGMEGSVFWMNPVLSDHSFQQYCDLRRGGWGLFAKIGAQVPRGQDAHPHFGAANLNDVLLLTPHAPQATEHAQFRSSRFVTYGTNWILRLDAGSRTTYFTPASDIEACRFDNVHEICGACACKTFVSASGPVASLEEIQFTDASQSVVPEEAVPLVYYVYTSPVPIKE